MSKLGSFQVCHKMINVWQKIRCSVEVSLVVRWMIRSQGLASSLSWYIHGRESIHLLKQLIKQSSIISGCRKHIDDFLNILVCRVNILGRAWWKRKSDLSLCHVSYNDTGNMNTYLRVSY